MPARLIVNADDFGLTLGVNRAIRELREAGVLSSATLMANGGAFEDAVAIARTDPGLGVGCHVVLVDGLPVSPPASIPTLLGSDGRSFRPSLADFVQALLRGQIGEAEIEREALAQVRKLQHAGIAVTHLDTHKHTHLFPRVARALLRVAERSEVPAIRNPFEPSWCRDLRHGSFVRRAEVALLGRMQGLFDALPQLLDGRVSTTAGSVGVSATGRLDRSSLHTILHSLPEGCWELVCHPGYNNAELDTVTTRLREHREIEREALLAEIPRRFAQPNPPRLIHYGSDAMGRPAQEEMSREL